MILLSFDLTNKSIQRSQYTQIKINYMVFFSFIKFLIYFLRFSRKIWISVWNLGFTLVTKNQTGWPERGQNFSPHFLFVSKTQGMVEHYLLFL